MKESSMLLSLTLVCAIIGLNPYLRKVEIPSSQKENNPSYWECWVNGKYTKITVTRGEMFKATLLTETLGTLLLHGSENVDRSGNITFLFGSIERKGETLAVGTFCIKKTKAEKTLLGEIKLVRENTSHAIILSPLQ